MKRNYALFLITCLCGVLSSYGQVSDLIISEYIEGSGFEKYIELYNGTGVPINLSNYELRLYANGSPTATTVSALSGTLNDGETIVYKNSNATLFIGTATVLPAVNFNGDDAIAIWKISTSSFVDIFGRIGNDPGSAWTATGYSTANRTLVRKPTVCAGVTVNPTGTGAGAFTTLLSEWDIDNIDVVTNLGLHTESCSSSDTSVQFASVAYSAGENNASVDICVTITNASTTNDTSVDVVLTSGSAPHLTYTTQTLSFPANTSDQQCATIAITNNSNCGDSNSYTFELQNVNGGDAASISINSNTVLTVNDDEGTNGPFRSLSFEPTDNWTYTTTGGGSVSSVPNKFFGTQSYELSGFGRLNTSNIDISSYDNVTLSVAFAADGPDSGEDLYLDISYDNGANWNGTGSIKLVDGFSNTNINIGDTNALNPTTVATNPWVVNIDPSETQIRVRLRAIGLDANEHYYIDDIILSGETCVAPCTPTHSVTDFTPIFGPEGTEVTINGSGFTSGTTVFFAGVPSTVTFIDANTLIAETPLGANTGRLTISENSCDITTSDFTLIDNNGSCGTLSNLIMTEIYDNDGGSLGYIEVFNGTGTPINLTNYFIRRYGDAGRFAANDYTDYTFAPGVVTIGDGQVIYGKISSDPDVASPNFNFGNSGFSGINGLDIFELRNNSGVIDVYIVPNNTSGYTALRNINTLGPNPTSNPSDWIHTITESTSDLGNFSYVALSSFPVIDTAPSDVTSCASEAIFSATAAPSTGGVITYQWFYNDGSALNWNPVTAGDFPLCSISGETTNELTLGSGFANYNGYQFYCLATEDGSCSTASNSVQLTLDVAVWSSSSWSSPPSIDTIVIIDDDYDTSIGGVNNETSFSACQLTINPGNILRIQNNRFVLVQNNLTVNGHIIVQTDGSFVQVNDHAIVDGAVTSDKTRITVQKETAILNSPQEYTYWSSPVLGETIADGLSESATQRRFWFNGANFRDSTRETGNNNATVAGQDDIDDDGNDWQFANGAMTMLPGVGYAATHSAIGFIGAGTQYIYTFEGPFNNGIYNIPIYRNDDELNDNNWNFIGNPYPSAIDADLFLAANTSIDQNAGPGATNGAIFFWSHNTAADENTNGNEVLNYSQSDYAIINGTDQTAGGDGVIPNRFIPSGQGFFISMSDTAPSTPSGSVQTTDVVFNNSMRVTGNNDQFFRSSNSSLPNKIRLNLTSDNGVFNQILIGYVEGATDADDGMYYDAYKNLSTNANSLLYSLIDTNTEKKFAIQGKSPSSLSLDEVIPLGFYTTITEATIYTLSIAHLQGEFMTTNSIYLKDNERQTIHNLSESAYNFTSETGEFNNRFEVVFQPEVLSVIENEINSNGLTIVELQNGNVKFSVGNGLTISAIEIIDLLGRTLYKLPAENAIELVELNNLSQTVYLAKVSLSNGQTITKRAVKRN